MPKHAKVTIDHDEIRHWVEARHGGPGMVNQTGTPNDVGPLRIMFAGVASEDPVRGITWSQFFEILDRDHLAFEFEDTKTGLFHRFISRKDADAARHPDILRPTRAKDRRAMRIAAREGADVQPQFGRRFGKHSKKTVRESDQGGREKKTKIRKAA